MIDLTVKNIDARCIQTRITIKYLTDRLETRISTNEYFSLDYDEIAILYFYFIQENRRGYIDQLREMINYEKNNTRLGINSLDKKYVERYDQLVDLALQD